MKDQHGNDVEFTCAICEQPMHESAAMKPHCRQCRAEPKRPHTHIRCRDCSPPGWWAVVFLKTLPGGRPDIEEAEPKSSA